MALYNKCVKKRLGEKFFEKIHDHAATISGDDLEEVARQLGEIPGGGPNRVFGHYKRRMERNMKISNQVLLREMLGDWWNEELYDMSTEAGRNKLINIFKSDTITGRDIVAKLEKEPHYHDPDGPAYKEIEKTSGQGSTPANNSACGGSAGGAGGGDTKSNGAGT